MHIDKARAIISDGHAKDKYSRKDIREAQREVTEYNRIAIARSISRERGNEFIRPFGK